jgi:hypothetical protein
MKDLPQTRIIPIEVEGLGEVKLRVPCSAWVTLDIPDIFQSTKHEARRMAKIEAAMIADCYVDENGNPVYDGYRDMLARLDPLVYPKLRAAALPVINSAIAKGDAEKNSENIPDSSQPSISQES